MATTTTNLGLKVWDLSTDTYSHTDLQANWNAIDAFAGKAGKAIQVVSNLSAGTAGGPASPLNAGDLVTTNTTVSGFPPWTLLRWDGVSTWEAIGPIEVQSAVPVSNLYTGRTVFLTTNNSNFLANTTIIYNGTGWQSVGLRKYAANVGDGSSTSFTITHNIGTTDVLVQIHESGSPYQVDDPVIEITDSNTVTLVFAVAPTSDQYRVVVIG